MLLCYVLYQVYGRNMSLSNATWPFFSIYVCFHYGVNWICPKKCIMITTHTYMTYMYKQSWNLEFILEWSIMIKYKVRIRWYKIYIFFHQWRYNHTVYMVYITWMMSLLKCFLGTWINVNYDFIPAWSIYKCL